MAKKAKKEKEGEEAAPEESAEPARNEAEAMDAISAFEQILEGMPNDRVALQALHDAYEQLGDTEKALEYLIRMSEVVAEENDLDAGRILLGPLDAAAESHKDAAAVAAKIRALLPADEAGIRQAPKGVAPPKRKDITAEMTLAWNLHQAGELNQGDYSQVVADLSENSSKELEVPVSVLHVLADRGATNIEKILTFIAKDSGVPVVSLDHFEILEDAWRLLPFHTLQHTGALPFETMGSHVLVAILNPYDEQLQADVAKEIGQTCHFYLVSASDYDATLNQIDTAIKTAEAEQKKQGG